MNADRNLLLGILALQNNFISRQQLLAAFDQWMTDKGQSLGQILEQQGAIAADRRLLLETLMAEHLKLHNNDSKKSLADLTPVGSVGDDLRRLGDIDVEASLAHVSAARVDDPNATQPWSVGESTSAGTRFRVLRPHARGGLGEVFVARDEELHREVALKEIQARHAHDPNSRSRFLMEAEITGGLEHPGIVPVYGLGTYADGRPFYAMRFIKGDSLKKAIERFHSAARLLRKGNGADAADYASIAERDADGGRLRINGAAKDAFSSLAFRKLLGRFIDVCNAIEYAHSRGVLHRDLKPGNIMLGKYGETLVVDWGLAKVMGRPEAHASGDELTLRPSSGSGSAPTQMGSAVGTPQYMSPEQAEGRLDELGPASDVYSLGATLYTLLTGQSPFRSADLGTILRQVAQGDFRPPRAVDSAIPRALEAICLKAMSLRPAGRYSTPRAFANDIEHWLANESISAMSETFSERLGRWSRRHRAWAQAATATLTILAITSILGFLVVDKARRNEQAERKRADDRTTAANDAERQAEERLGESLYQQASNLTHTTPQGWRARTLSCVKQAVALGRGDRLRDAAAQALLGFDLDTAASFAHENLRTEAALSRDGRLAAIAEKGQVSIWNIAVGAQPQNLHPLEPIPNDEILLLRFDNAGRRLLGADAKGNVFVWNVTTGQLFQRIDAHEYLPDSVVFGPGQNMLSSSDGETVSAWRLDTGLLTFSESLTPPPPTPPPAPEAPAPAPPALDPSGSRTLRDHYKSVAFQVPRNLRSAMRATVKRKASLAASEEGDILVALCDGQPLRLWRITDQENLELPEGAGLSTYLLSETAIEITADGRLVVIAATSSVPEPPAPAPPAAHSLPKRSVGGLALAERAHSRSPNPRASATLLHAVSSYQVAFLQPAPLQPQLPAVSPVQPLQPTQPLGALGMFGQVGIMSALGPLPLDRAAAAQSISPVASSKNEPAFVAVYDVEQAAYIAKGRISPMCSISGISISEDGSDILVAGNADTGPRLCRLVRHDDSLLQIATASADRAVGGGCAVGGLTDRLLAARGYQVYAFDLEGEQQVKRILRPAGNEYVLSSFADGVPEIFAADMPLGDVRVYGGELGNFLGVLGDTGEAREITVSRDAKSIAVLTAAGQLKVFRLKRVGNSSHQFALDERFSAEHQPLEKVVCLGLSADGKWLAFGTNKNLLAFWHDEGAIISYETLRLDTAETPVSLQFTADGTNLAVTYDDGSLRIWETARRRLLAEIREAGTVYTMAFSPDRQLLLTGALNGETVVRVAGTLKRITKLPTDSDAIAIAFSPNGEKVALGHVNSTVTIWDVATWRKDFGWRTDERGIQRLGFQADGNRLVIGDLTGYVCSYDLRHIGDELDRLGLTWRRRTPGRQSATAPAVRPLAAFKL